METVEKDPERSPMGLKVTGTTAEGYSLVSSAIWVGEHNVSPPPTIEGSNVPDVSIFPYTYTSTTQGETTWEIIVMVESGASCGVNMTQFSLSTMTQVTVQQSGGGQLDAYAVEDGLAGSFVYDGTELTVLCECVKETETEICIDTGLDNIREECYDLLVGEAGSAGKVCIEIVDNSTKFQVTYTASGDWTLITTEFWIGDNISAVPVDEDGALDTDSFPYFYCNSTGEESWVAKFEMKWQYNCLDMDDFTLAVVGQATVAKYNSTTGEVIEETEVVAFAHEYDGSSNDNYFGWFDIQVGLAQRLIRQTFCRVRISHFW
jgi:hypothetical protein